MKRLQVILSEKRLISYNLRGVTVVSPLSSVFIIEPEMVHSAAVHREQTDWGDLRTFLISRSCFDKFLGEQAARIDLHFASPICSARQCCSTGSAGPTTLFSNRGMISPPNLHW